VAFTKKGFWGGQPAQDDFGNAFKNAAVTVYIAGTNTHATLYTDDTGGSTAANPITSDEHGNLQFFADVAFYELGAAGDPYRVKVQAVPSPNEPNSSAVQSVNGRTRRAR
jgi:hypothetical protein